MPRVFAGRSGPVYATAGKELRYMRRDPRFRSQAVGLAIALAALGFGAGRFLLGTEYAPFLATVIAWMVASTGFNLFGMDDRSFWAYVVSGVDLRQILAGKNLALALIGVPGGEPRRRDSGHCWSETSRTCSSAILASIAVLAVWHGVGNITSVLGAFPMPESNLFGSRNASAGGGGGGNRRDPGGRSPDRPGGSRGRVAGGVARCLAGPDRALSSPLTLGWLAYRLSLKIAGGILETRAPRILEVLDKPPV